MKDEQIQGAPLPLNMGESRNPKKKTKAFYCKIYTPGYQISNEKVVKTRGVTYICRRGNKT
ncbi:hypothetical protein CW304_16440 [Bacillus sp. UFRGS-B20]|nr:hypothetical protein CW304_16440 [Bacillus sp. UFRGS-B20]